MFNILHVNHFRPNIPINSNSLGATQRIEKDLVRVYLDTYITQATSLLYLFFFLFFQPDLGLLMRQKSDQISDLRKLQNQSMLR